MSLYSLSPSEYSAEQWQEEIHRVKDIVLERSRPSAILVFGSSLGDSRTAESDIDLAVIFETEEQAFAARKNIPSGAPFRNVPVDILVFSETEFNSAVGKGGVVDKIRSASQCIHGLPPWSEENQS